MLIKFCKDCKLSIQGCGSKAFYLLEQICERYVYTGKMIEFLVDEALYMKDFLDTIRSLEKKNYILSTESKQEYIKIKPLGVLIYEKNGKGCCDVCFNRDKHK